MKRPDDIKITPPASDVPASCAAYSGKWAATDSYGRKLEFWVEKIDRDCIATVVYCWGPSPGSTVVSEAGYHRTTGTIKPDGLFGEIPQYKGRGKYRLRTDGKIEGEFWRGERGYVLTCFEKQ